VLYKIIYEVTTFFFLIVIINYWNALIQWRLTSILHPQLELDNRLPHLPDSIIRNSEVTVNCKLNAPTSDNHRRPNNW